MLSMTTSPSFISGRFSRRLPSVKPLKGLLACDWLGTLLQATEQTVGSPVLPGCAEEGFVLLSGQCIPCPLVIQAFHKARPHWVQSAAL